MLALHSLDLTACWRGGLCDVCKALDIVRHNCSHSKQQVHKHCVLWTRLIHGLEAMAKHSWPNGVTSWKDTVKFAQLVFGTDVHVEDYSQRLPHLSDKSFLLFAKGACREGTPLYQVPALIVPQLEEIRVFEEGRGNYARPTKSQQMLQGSGVHTYYWTAQLTRAPCTCRTPFGGDKHMKHVPTCSSNWTVGNQFARLWDATLLRNYEEFQNRSLRPVWLDKSWQALWNWNDHNQGHGIDLHSDKSDTYSSLDPITSLSFGHGGVLTLGAKIGQPATKMLFQENGDALVMAGEFQREFVHGVPPRHTWGVLKEQAMFTGMKDWEKLGLAREIELHQRAVAGEMHVRANCTIRWHATHLVGCPMRPVQGSGHGSRTELVVTGEVQPDDPWAMAYQRDEPLHLNVSVPASGQLVGFHGSRTEPVVTGEVQPSEPRAMDEPLRPNVSAPASVQFAGLKRFGRTGAEQIQIDHGCQRVHDRAVQTDGLPDIVRTLLACLDQCAQQSELFRLVLHSIPMVEAKEAHAETLLQLESTVQQLRKQLVVASEAVEGLAGEWDYSVEYNCLNLMSLAARQRAEMHKEFGMLRTTEGSWLIESSKNKPDQNCLNKEAKYFKCLLSHYHLELMLEVLCVRNMKEHGEIAFDLAKVPDGSLPEQLWCAKRSHQAKRHQNENLGLDVYELRPRSVVLMKALEIGYVKEGHKLRRVLTSKHVLTKLLEELEDVQIVDSLQRGVRTALQHLRTLDVDRNLCDRKSEGVPSNDYDIWVWIRHVDT